MSDPELLGSAYTISSDAPEGHMEDIAVWDAEVKRAVAAHARCDGCCRWNGHGRAAAATSRQYCRWPMYLEALSALLDRDHQRLVILTRGMR